MTHAAILACSVRTVGASEFLGERGEAAPNQQPIPQRSVLFQEENRFA